MNDSINIAKELKKELEKDPLIKEYRRLKKLIDANEELNSLKKEIALAKVHNNEALHKSLLDRYNSHPLVLNFVTLKEEVNDLLKQISEIVNKK